MNSVFQFATNYWKSIAASIFILIVCLIPSPNIPNTIPTINDKVIHCGLYVCLTFILLQELKQTKNRIAIAIIYAISFGIGIEILQTFTQSRSYDLHDLLANSIGTLSAVILYLIYNKIRQQR